MKGRSPLPRGGVSWNLHRAHGGSMLGNHVRHTASINDTAHDSMQVIAQSHELNGHG